MQPAGRGVWGERRRGRQGCFKGRRREKAKGNDRQKGGTGAKVDTFFGLIGSAGHMFAWRERCVEEGEGQERLG